MKRFDERVGFQGSAQSQGFRPVQAPDSTPLLRQNMETERQSMDNVREFGVKSGLQDLENSRLPELAGFSQTVTELLTTQLKNKAAQLQEEGLQLAYADGLPQQVVETFDQQEQKLRAAHENIQQVADKAQEKGEPFEGVYQIRQLSGWKRYGYAMGIAQTAGSQYQSAMEQALAELPQDTPVAEKAAALATARGRFLSQLRDVNPALLNKYAFPSMREADATILNRWRKEDISRTQDRLADEAMSVWQSDPVNGFNDGVNALIRSGKYDRRAARVYLLNQINDPTQIDSIGMLPSWDGKTSWADKYPLEWAEAKRRAIKNESEAYQTDKLAVELEGRQWFDSVQQLWQENPPTDREIAEARRYMEDNFDFVDPGLESYRARSTDREAERYYSEIFDRADRAGRLTEDMVNDPRVPKATRDAYIDQARRADKARNETPEFKQYTEQLKEDIRNVTGLASVDGTKPGQALAVAKAQSDYQRIYLNKIQGGATSAAQAAAEAYAEVKAQIDAGDPSKTSSKPGGGYKYDPNEGFVNVIPKTISGSWDRHKASIDRVLGNAPKNDAASVLDRTLLVPRSQIEDAVRNSNSPNWNPPPIAQYISDRFGGSISPYEVMVRQTRAHKAGELTPPPALEAAQQTMRPEFMRLLNYRPSSRRVSRAYISTGSFNPALVKNGWGNTIMQAASANGVDPGLLAGLIEVESGFNPNQVSEAGAVGIAQIVPKYHPGVDATNPRDSIFYAAKYLKQLEKQLGSIDEAVYAYNGGPAGIRKSAENRAYHPKVMKAAAKYGYGASQGWSNPALLHPRIAYITGNIGPTSTGPHLDVKRTDGGRFNPKALDNYVLVDDPTLGRVPLSRIPITDTFDGHVARGSHGIDYGTYSGSKVYLRGGAKVIASTPTEHGDKLTIELPNGQTYTFLHGKKA